MKITTGALEIGLLIHAVVGETLPVYPIIAEEGAKYPFATYRRTYTEGRDTKDRYDYEERVGMDVTVAAATYPESVALARAVKTRLEQTRGTWNEMLISRIEMTGADEDWSADAYVQRLRFSITIDKPNKR